MHWGGAARWCVCATPTYPCSPAETPPPSPRAQAGMLLGGAERTIMPPCFPPQELCLSPTASQPGGRGARPGGVHQLNPPPPPPTSPLPTISKGRRVCRSLQTNPFPGGGDPPGHPPTNNCLEGASGIQGSDMVGGEGGLSCVKRPPAVGAATSLLGDRFSTSRLHPHTHTHVHNGAPPSRYTPGLWLGSMLPPAGHVRLLPPGRLRLISVGLRCSCTSSDAISPSLCSQRPPQPRSPIGQAVV